MEEALEVTRLWFRTAGYYSLLAVIIWYVGWFIIYVFTGVHLTRVYYRKGVILIGVSFKSKKLSVRAGLIRVKLWGKLKHISIEDVDVVIVDDMKNKKKKGKKDAKLCEIADKLVNSVYPKGKMAQKVVKLIVNNVPTLDFQIRNVLVVLAHPSILHTIKTHYLRLLLLLRQLAKVHDNNKYDLVVSASGFNYSVAEASNGSKSRVPILVDLAKLHAKFAINRKTGAVLGVILQLTTDELKFSVFALIKMSRLERKKKHIKVLEKLREGKIKLLHTATNLLLARLLTDVEEEDDTALVQLAKVFDFVEELVERISITSENTQINEIPFYSLEHNETFEEYFNNHVASLYLNVTAKTISMTTQRLYPIDAGYNLMFSEKDRPFHMLLVMQLVTVDQIVRHSELCAKNGVELVNVPNLSLLCKTQILQTVAQLIIERGAAAAAELNKAVDNESDASLMATATVTVSEDGEGGLLLGVIEMYANLTNPIVEINSELIGALLYNVTILKKYTIVKRLVKLAEMEELEEEEQMAPTSNKWLADALQKTLPRIDSRVVVEKPRFLLQLTQLIDFSFELFDLDVQRVPGLDPQYARVIVLHPKVMIWENLRPKYELLQSERVTAEVQLQDLLVEPIVTVERVHVNLGQLSSLEVVHQLFEGVLEQVVENLKIGRINKELNAAIDKNVSEQLARLAKEEGEAAYVDPLTKVFDYLPLWLIGAKARIHNIDFNLGSRLVLIPKLKLGDTNTEELCLDNTGPDQQLRSATLQVKEVCVDVANLFSLAGSLPKRPTHPKNLGPKNTTDIVFWQVAVLIREFEVKVSTLLESLCVVQPDMSQRRFIYLDEFDVMTSLMLLGDKNTLAIDVSIGNWTVKFDRYKLFTLLGVVHVFRCFVASPIRRMVKRIKGDIDDFDQNAILCGHHQVKHEIANPLEWLQAKLVMGYLDCHINIDEGVDIRSQLVNTKALLKDKMVDAVVEGFRVLFPSPTVKHWWTRLLYVDLLLVQLPAEPLPKITATTKQLRMLHPDKFIPFKVFDNLLILMKIIKHFVKASMNHNEDLDEAFEREVWPLEMKPIKLPEIELTTPEFTLCMEDDAFELELGLNFQLGLVEQRKRMEMMLLYDIKLANAVSKGQDVDEYDQELYTLREQISGLWIRKVKSFREKLVDQSVNNNAYLFGNELKAFGDKNDHVSPYSVFAPLMKVVMNGVRAMVKEPLFGMENIKQFIHDKGQGQPLDMLYTTLVPMFAQLDVDHARVHLRDYPVALLTIPKNESGRPAFQLSGDLVIGEQFTDKKESMRRIYCPFIEGVKQDGSHKADLPEDLYHERKGYYGLVVNKTLTPVKMYADAGIHISSSGPTRFIWGTSYAFALQQIGSNFDLFSKPPIDPLDKIGSWDTVKLLTHGIFSVKIDDALEVAFKGSRDPYNVFQTAAGFILLFSDNVEWTVNPNDDSRDFMKVAAQKVKWYIPNYLALPIWCWAQPRQVWLPKTLEFVTSAFGYDLIEGITVKDLKEVDKHPVLHRTVVQLSGGIDFTLGFLLTRKDELGEVSDKCKHHWEVDLVHPNYAKEGHDSYRGWRTDYLAMKIALNSNRKTSYNTIHLLTGTFRIIKDWWHLFASNMMLPIRKLAMFGLMHKAPPKFSQHLVLNIFEFHVKLLWAAHVYRDDICSTDYDKIECVGLRAMIDDFVVDVHQKRGPVVMKHGTLDEEMTVQKMLFNSGEIHLNEIDLRMLKATFKQNVYQTYDAYQNKQNDSGKKTVDFETFCGDSRWFDINDYEETDTTTLRNTPAKAAAYPVLFTRKFSFIRNTGDKDIDETDLMLGLDKIHRCILKNQNVYNEQVQMLEERIADLKLMETPNDDHIQVLESELADLRKKKDNIDYKLHERCRSGHIHPNPTDNYQNRFILVLTYFKYNEMVRNVLLRYVYYVTIALKVKNYLDYELIRTVDTLIEADNSRGDTALLVLKDHPLLLPRKCFTQRFTRNLLVAPTVTTGAVADNENPELAQYRMLHFTELLEQVLENQVVSEDYLIEVLHPQFQLQLANTPNLVVFITAPLIECRIALVHDKNDPSLDPPELETRYGVEMKNALIFILNNSAKLMKLGVLDTTHNYGCKGTWPPWLGVEVFDNPEFIGKEHLLVESLNVIFTYEAVGALAAATHDHEDHQELLFNRMNVDIPKLVILLTLSQYFTLYLIMLDLFSYTDPGTKFLLEKLEKMQFSTYFQDLTQLRLKLLHLGRHYLLMWLLLRNFYFRQGTMDNSELNEFMHLKRQLSEIVEDIYFTMSLILTGDYATGGLLTKTIQKWRMQADQIILHLLEDDRTPLVDFAFAQAVFSRQVFENGLNNNRVDIAMMQSFNLLEKSKCPMVLAPLNEMTAGNADGKHLISSTWKVNRLVGGIKMIEDFQVNCQPLLIMLDEITLNRLLNFALQTDLDGVMDLPVIQRAQELEKNQNARNDALKSKLDLEEHQASKLLGMSLTLIDSELIPELDEMMDRSKQFFSVNRLRVSPLKVLVLIKLKSGYMRLLNVTDFIITMPEFKVVNQITLMMEVADQFKNMAIKTLLNHIVSLLRNKMTRSSTKSSSKLAARLALLRQLKNYNGFVDITSFKLGGSSLRRASVISSKVFKHRNEDTESRMERLPENPA